MSLTLAHPLAKCALVCMCAAPVVPVVKQQHKVAHHRVAHKPVHKIHKAPIVTERIVYRDCVLPVLPDQSFAVNDLLTELRPVVTPLGQLTPAPPLTFTSPPITRQPVDVPAAVPEPATWALMFIGFGAVGWIFRINNRTQAHV